MIKLPNSKERHGGSKMRLGQNVYGRRYFIYARRNDKEMWTDWTQVDDLYKACFQVKNIRNCGFFAKLIDRHTREVLIADE